MNEEIDNTEPLGLALKSLRQPVPVAPGLPQRMNTRAARQRLARITSSGLAIALAAVTALIVQRAPGTRITFAIDAPAGQSVELVGDFTNWQTGRVKLERSAAGAWQTTLRLPPGRYRFAYVVNRNEWRADSHAAIAPDDFGRPTSVLNVAGN